MMDKETKNKLQAFIDVEMQKPEIQKIMKQAHMDLIIYGCMGSIIREEGSDKLIYVGPALY